VRHLRLAEVGSTNDAAREAFERAEPLPLLLSAERQTGGRGRSGRVWSHARSNFAGTFLIEAAPILRSEPGAVSLLAALAVRDSLVAFGTAPEAIALKWPNDVLYNGRKVAGILTEFVTSGAREAFAIGIGVNLTEAPTDTAFPAGAVFSIPEAPAPEAFGDRLGTCIAGWAGRAGEEGAGRVFDAWRASAWRIGENVTVRQDGGALRGMFADIDSHGRMVLKLEGGEFRTISVGDAGPA
jgi:BirA family biotin operon repressor/biotin-[acetyl-CoA-carboxylase] ligase